MHRRIDRLNQLREALAAEVLDALESGDVRGMSDTDMLALMDVAASLGRLSDGLVIETAGAVVERCDTPVFADRLSTKMGCRNARDLIEQVTRVSGQGAGEYLRAGKAVGLKTSDTGMPVPPEFPGMRDALTHGFVGLDGVVAVVRELPPTRFPHEIRDAADAELSAVARGDGAEGEPLPSADALRLQAQVWAMFLDQDGAEPREAAAFRKRGVTVGPVRDGLCTIKGLLIADVAGQLVRLFDSVENPKLSGPSFGADADAPMTAVSDLDAPHDDRTRPQRHHDALATIFTVAARAGELPTIGGAAPTLLVSVRERDLKSGHGFAHIDGVDEPVSLAVARHVACTGVTQRVTLNDRGGIVAISIPDRVFNAHQRRAITLRDGGCVIPGCHVRASWCEIHHIEEASRGGPTHTSNGVLLCWRHHRTLDTNGWSIRSVLGTPEIRGPAWWDPTGTWRLTTKSPTRARDHHHDRT